MAGVLTVLAACEKRPVPVATQKTTNTSQGGSAEGLVIVGLYALKKLRECSEQPEAPCVFRDEAQASGNRQRPEKPPRSSRDQAP